MQNPSSQDKIRIYKWHILTMRNFRQPVSQFLNLNTQVFDIWYQHHTLGYLEIEGLVSLSEKLYGLLSYQE